MNNFIQDLKLKKVLLCDGAMGTELQKRGLQVGVCPEELNISNPQIIKAIHKDYISSGSDIIETNTFGANRLRLKFYGLENKVKEINLAAVMLAKEAANGNYVGGSIGPIGELIEPFGIISEMEAYDAFAEQALFLQEGGANVLFIETMMSIEELLIAIKAVHDNSNPPLIATMTFEKNNGVFKTSWGVDINTFITRTAKSNLNVIGSNCGKGFDDMVELIDQMKEQTDLPIIAQANAGIPEFINGVSFYKETPENILPKVEHLLKSGVKIIGGCCGTTPAHIKKMREAVDLFLQNPI